MSDYRHIDVSEVGDVTVVRFRDRNIIGDIDIQELRNELFRLVEQDGKRKILLNFSGVSFVSGNFVQKLVWLHKRVKAHGGQLKFCNVRPDELEVYRVTGLNRLFDIQDDEADALAAF